MTPTTRQVGLTLKRLRQAKGLSQVAVAAKAQLTREHLSRLEAGRYDPTLRTLNRLARALGVPVTELLR
jgi:transcriptional regulator with XRE-family HTH domain